MTCTVCGVRPAKRACPALKVEICPVCCGTKRQVEIRCPSDCQYLSSARAHPAAVVRRQQEGDLRLFLPTVRDLNERQANLLTALLSFVRDYRGDELLRTTDADVETAAKALAETYETAARGVIFEHRPSSLPAQRLADDLSRFIAAQGGGEAGSSLERDLAVVFRAIERGARDARKSLPGGDTAYLALLRRMLVPNEPKAEQPDPTGLVQPGGSLLIRP